MPSTPCHFFSLKNVVVGCHVHIHTGVGGWAKGRVREGETRGSSGLREGASGVLARGPYRLTLGFFFLFPTVTASVLPASLDDTRGLRCRRGSRVGRVAGFLMSEMAECARSYPSCGTRDAHIRFSRLILGVFCSYPAQRTWLPSWTLHFVIDHRGHGDMERPRDASVTDRL